MFRPEDLLHFIETRGFTDTWAGLGLDDADLAALQFTIMRDGRNAPVVQGTDGLRKLRFAPPRWNVGKLGALRVCFVHFEKFGVVLLVLAYAKTAQDNIAATEKKALRALIAEYEQELARLNPGR